MNFFKNLSISRFVISLSGLQVSRSLKTFKTIKSGLQCTIYVLARSLLSIGTFVKHNKSTPFVFSIEIDLLQ